MVNEVSERITARYHGTYNNGMMTVAFDPATVALVTKVIIEIVSLWKMCNMDPEGAQVLAGNQATGDVDKVRETVRAELWWWQYWSYGEKIV